VMKLLCCTSLSRIEMAARGVECDHLQCFDLASYVHTMRNIPPKHAWCCPICDRPAPLHQLRLDAFAQSVLDGTEPNVTEVLVADNGKFEVSATEEPVGDGDDSSDDEMLPAQFRTQPQRVTQFDLQQAALNLGRAFSATPGAPAPQRPAPAAPVPQRPAPAANPSPPAQRSSRGRSRSPKRPAASAKQAAASGADETADKRKIWEKLQGIAKPEPEKPKPAETPPEPKQAEAPRVGWLPEGARCSRCEKTVVERGGVYCSRRRANGEFVGCFVEICWKCMNKGSKDEIGGIRTSKTEFSSLGPDAWWMHERCMTPEDKRSYFGEEEDDDVGKPKDAEESDEEPGTFAWE